MLVVIVVKPTVIADFSRVAIWTIPKHLLPFAGTLTSNSDYGAFSTTWVDDAVIVFKAEWSACLVRDIDFKIVTTYGGYRHHFLTHIFSFREFLSF